MTDLRLPRLLGADLKEKARLRPSKASAVINLSPLSTASMTLPEGEETVGVRDFMELYGPEGSLGIFRVAIVQQTYGNQQQLTLEHGIVTLEDSMVPDNTTLSGSMKTMLTKLIGCQSKKMWELGDVEVSGGLDDIKAGTSNLLEAFLTVISSDDTAMLAFDQTRFPWVVHVRKKPSDVSCECRLNRNIQGVDVRLDDAELCTRVTVEDADDKLYTYDADTISAWGVVHKGITIEKGDDPAEEGRKYLDAHKNPALSVDLDALALAALTGETRDRFALGELCRVALPEWGVVMDERIVSMSYPDLFGQPEQVRLTLSDTRTDASTRLATLESVQRKNARGVTQALKYYRELDDKAVIMAKEIELRATKDELGKYLNEVYIKLDAHDASITLNAQHIDKATNEITAAGERIDGLNAALTQYAGIVDSQGNLLSGVQVRLDGIDQTLTQQAGRFDKLGNLIDGAQLQLDGLKSEIALKVSKDGLISAINLSPEQIRIASSKVVLDGYVTASQLEAEVARFDSVFAGSSSVTALNVSRVYAGYLQCSGSMSFGGTFVSWKSISVMTERPSLSVETAHVTYKDTNNINQVVDVVTKVNFNRGTLSTINYLGA